MTAGELARIMAYGQCHEAVTRQGELLPCNKTAVAVRLDPEDHSPYPVCGYHARGEMVALPQLLEAVRNPDPPASATADLINSMRGGFSRQRSNTNLR